jgi:hypothetical protein
MKKGGGKIMARYQILYWQHIPLGVKATDIESTVRENLPIRFQEAFQEAAAHDKNSEGGKYTTSGFRWSEESERDGSASDVAAAVAQELIESWDIVR